jgi:hypothetical protein
MIRLHELVLKNLHFVVTLLYQQVCGFFCICPKGGSYGWSE